MIGLCGLFLSISAISSLTTSDTVDKLLINIRYQSILLLFSLIFLSGNSSFLTYYAQDFAQNFNILLKVKLYNTVATEQ